MEHVKVDVPLVKLVNANGILAETTPSILYPTMDGEKFTTLVVPINATSNNTPADADGVDPNDREISAIIDDELIYNLTLESAEPEI